MFFEWKRVAFLAILWAVLWLSLSTWGHSETRVVPDDFSTIQAAVDASNDGDRVEVRAGDYVESIVIDNKSIEVVSLEGPDLTTISPLAQGTVVLITGPGANGTLFQGFRITGGTIDFPGGDGGSGFRVIESSPIISDNIIEDNTGSATGGGIHLLQSDAVIEDNLIRNNDVACPLVLSFPCGSGGGIATLEGNPTIRRNIIANNAAANQAGAILVSLGDPVIEDNEIVDNIAVSGGGILIQPGSSGLIRNNLIARNVAAGIATQFGLFPGFGGGLWIGDDATVELIQNTIAENEALSVPGIEGSGAGIYNFSMMTTVSNSIVWGNTSDLNPHIADLGQVVVDYTLVEGGFPGTGNLDEDPLFVTGPAGDYFLAEVDAGQLFTSPAVDAGDPTITQVAGTTRTDLIPDTGIIDLGFHRVSIPSFVRGEVNGDAVVNIADPVFLLQSLFVPGTAAPNCRKAADANDDGTVNIADAVTTLQFLFVPGSSDIPPPNTCGADPTPDSLDCLLVPNCP